MIVNMEDYMHTIIPVNSTRVNPPPSSSAFLRERIRVRIDLLGKNLPNLCNNGTFFLKAINYLP